MKKKCLIVKRYKGENAEIVETSTKKKSILKLYEKVLSKRKYDISFLFDTRSDKMYHFWFKKGKKLIEVFDIDF